MADMLNTSAFSGYMPSFGVGKNFKTIAKPGALKDAGDFFIKDGGYIDKAYIDRMMEARPDLFEGIKPEDLWTAGKVEAGGNEEMGFQYKDGFIPTQKLRDLLSGYGLQRMGAEGMKDGRTNALVDAQGNLVYADKPYSYDPAGDTLKSVTEAAALAAVAFGGIGALGHGPLAGLFGGAGAGTGVPFELGSMGAEGAAAGGAAGAAGSAGGGMLTNGAFLGEGVASGVGAWDAAMAGADAFSTVMSLTGSEALASAASGVAKAASTGADWLSSTWSALTGGGASGAVAGAAKSAIGSYFSGSSVLRDLLPIIGSGVNQATAEKMAKDQRNWQSAEKQKDRDFEEKKASDTRRRQMPTTGPGLLGKFRVIPGAGNGG